MLSSRLFVCLTLAITVSTVFGQNLHELIEEVKDDIERHLSKEQLEVFYERYYDSYDILDGFDVSKVCLCLCLLAFLHFNYFISLFLFSF